VEKRVLPGNFIQKNNLVAVQFDGVHQQFVKILKNEAGIRIPRDVPHEPLYFIVILEPISQNPAFKRIVSLAEKSRKENGSDRAANRQDTKRAEKSRDAELLRQNQRDDEKQAKTDEKKKEQPDEISGELAERH